VIVTAGSYCSCVIPRYK